jgi:hypothetical protein
MDHLCRGELGSVGDVLLQRFKAVEMAARDSNWSVSQHLELIPKSSVSASSSWKRRAAADLELSEIRFREKLDKSGNRKDRGGKG